MKKIIFRFINGKGQEKNGSVWIDEGTFAMVQKLEDKERTNYLREIYYDYLKEQKYRRKTTSLDKICKMNENIDGEDFTFEFQDSSNIENDVITEIQVREVLEKFTDFEKELIKEVLIKNSTQKEFAIKNNIAQQNISRKIKKIKEKLQKVNIFLGNV